MILFEKKTEKRKFSRIMDSRDKSEEWQMLVVGRKLVVRPGAGEGREETREWEREREGEQIWATVTLGRWLRALCSVYVTLTVQAKTATRQKWNLQQDECLQVNVSPPPLRPRAHFNQNASFARAMSRGGWKHLCVQVGCRSHSVCLSSRPQTNCLLFSRGQGLVGLQSTQ